jgi:peptide/nickel transport system permease protein
VTIALSRPRTLDARAWRPTVVLAWVVVALVLVMAFFPGLFADAAAATDAEVLNKLKPPSAEHWFGTDYLGRDIYTRVVYGSAVSLQATSIAVAIAFFVGSGVGLVAGYAGGWLETALMRLVDILLAIPSLLLSIAIVAALGFGAVNVAIGVGIASVATFARLVRGEVLRVKSSVYVEASSALGLSRRSVVLRHVLPNAIGPAFVLAALEFGTAVLAVSALSFLGYGEPAPTPEWGRVVAEGRDYLAVAWWPVVLPSIVICAVALAATRLARAYDDQEGRSR